MSTYFKFIEQRVFFTAATYSTLISRLLIYFISYRGWVGNSITY